MATDGTMTDRTPNSTAAHPAQHSADLVAENAALRGRLARAEEALRAIRGGEVDALVLAGPGGGAEIYALRTADHAFRVLVEQMQEGAVVVSADGAILYANPCFAG